MTATVELARVFFTQVDVVGSTMGSRTELEQLIGFLVASGARPVVDQVLPLEKAAEGFARMIEGDLFGKIVFTP
jgi:D-arabinose 1-dehydrogenase-like Zn-dependent alcohol dehydrogenase